MTGEVPVAARPGTDGHRAVILEVNRPEDRELLAGLRADPWVVLLDHRASMIDELRATRPSPTEVERGDPDVWVYYPWRRTVVSLLRPEAFRRLRLDRNRNKITPAEQAHFGRLKIGIVGLSVGHAIAHTLAMEGLCGELRMADHDHLELSNLNRVPASLLDLGINKAVVTARRIAELDPYLTVEVFTEGLTEKTMPTLLDGLDLLIEECDSLDMKLRVRQEARARGIPVLMQTSDRGLFDVERFDLEPDRPFFHGLLGELEPASLSGLTGREKVPYVMRILQTAELSARMAASMVEIDHTVSTWPQLGGDVALGAATVAAAVRRFGRGVTLSSGRLRIDLDARLGDLDATPNAVALPVLGGEVPCCEEADLTARIPADPLQAVVHAIRLAPSGGNSQPWSLARSAAGVEIGLASERTSAMDVRFRGSYVAIGAAGFNARVAAAGHAAVGAVTEFPDGAASDVVLSLTLGDGADQELADQYPAMIGRVTNRNFGRREPLSGRIAGRLRAAAEAEGAGLRLVTAPSQLAGLAEVLGESDRLRYLTPLLHGEMTAELKWPGRDRLDAGIDVRTLGLDPADLAKLEVADRSDVMSLLAEWGGGAALGGGTRDRVTTCSALAVITVCSDSPRDYLCGGAAAERVWISADRDDLGVQPLSPVFLYARDDNDRWALSPHFSLELAHLQRRFEEIVGLQPNEVPALVLRLSHHAGSAVRSARLPLAQVLTAAVSLMAAAP
jgi:molybdopterin/thiamine biosynthesis adenylyltransferase